MVAPYPFERWPRVSRADARRLREGLGSMPVGDREAAIATAEALLGARPRCTPGAALVLGPDRIARALAEPFVALVFEHGVEAAREISLVVLPPAFAARLAERVLGGRAEAAPPGVLDGVGRGVLAYFAARVAAAFGGLRLLGAASDAGAVRSVLGGKDAVAVPIRVTLDAFESEVRWWWTSSPSNASVRPTPALLGTPSQVEVTLVADVARDVLTRAELASLAPGDVVVPERCRLVPGAGGLDGEAVLHVEGARRARWRCRAERATLTIEALDVDEEIGMTEGTIKLQPNAPDATQLAGDAPIEIAVEIARFTLPLEELASLRVGTVLSTGRAIGERVVLRAGGRAVAQGELVDVDGEVGVRVQTLSE